MLDLPGEVVAEAVRQLELIQRVVVKVEFAVGLPRPRQLQFVEYAEFHSFLPRSRIPAYGAPEGIIAERGE